jgi:hypothetical protein
MIAAARRGHGSPSLDQRCIMRAGVTLRACRLASANRDNTLAIPLRRAATTVAFSVCALGTQTAALEAMAVWEKDDEATQCAPLPRHSGSRPDAAIPLPERGAFADDDAATAFFSLRAAPAQQARQPSAPLAFADPSEEATAFFQPPRPHATTNASLAARNAAVPLEVPQPPNESPHGVDFDYVTAAGFVDNTQRLAVPAGFSATYTAIAQAYEAHTNDTQTHGHAHAVPSTAATPPVAAPLAPWSISALPAQHQFANGQSPPPMHASMASGASYPALNYPSGENTVLTDGVASRLVLHRKQTGWAVAGVAVLAGAALAFGVARLHFNQGASMNVHAANAASSHVSDSHDEGPPAAPHVATTANQEPPAPQLAAAETPPSAPANALPSAITPERSASVAAPAPNTAVGKHRGTAPTAAIPAATGGKPKASQLGSRELVLSAPAARSKPASGESAAMTASQATHQAAAASLKDSL